MPENDPVEHARAEGEIQRRLMWAATSRIEGVIHGVPSPVDSTKVALLIKEAIDGLTRELAKELMAIRSELSRK